MASSGDGGDGGSSGYESEEAVAPPPKKIRKAREFPFANPTLLQERFFFFIRSVGVHQLA
jgi:hypothetical protein